MGYVQTHAGCLERSIKPHHLCGIESRAQDQPLTQTLANLPTPAAGLPPDDRVEALLKRVRDSLDDAKAEDVLAIDLAGKTSIADTMLIATGRSNTHVNAIADRVLKSCKGDGSGARVEGMPQCDWVLIDAGDLIVHIFRPEVRQFYNLEKMWGVDRPDERRPG
jgi:ribosome-associated protein